MTRTWSERFAAVMPMGSSTASKVPTLQPDEPEVIVRADGCRVWDDRGREYIDFRNALGPVTLGYRHPVVDQAIRRQLDNGIVFGHPHPLECEIAERFCELVPCAEMVGFLKTGGEAIAATIRIARAYTGRDHVIQIGYNGWLNTLSGGGADLPGRTATAVHGVPIALSELHHPVRWSDMARVRQLFDQYPGQIAAVVVAADYAGFEQGATFYPELRALTSEHGALLVFDEIVTGFRVAVGGVQEYFGVTPDLAVFGKGIANGMPLAVYAGRREVMQVCGPGKLVVTSTFGGETLSLAAAAACLDVYQEYDVVGYLWRQGEALWSSVQKAFDRYGLPLELSGVWPCPALVSTNGDEEVVSAFLRAAYRNGVSLYRVPYVNFSHRDDDVAEAVRRLERACAELAR
jgi:glutamate-1-semialdehyde 2,1-aminomutase